jgi:hypothetical protein
MTTTLVSMADDGDRFRLTPRQSARAARAQREADLFLFLHRLDAAVATEMDRQDTFALGDVLTTATDEELRFLDHGLALAGSSAAKVELVARKIEMFSNINNRRIARRFGR